MRGLLHLYTQQAKKKTSGKEWWPWKGPGGGGSRMQPSGLHGEISSVQTGVWAWGESLSPGFFVCLLFLYPPLALYLDKKGPNPTWWSWNFTCLGVCWDRPAWKGLLGMLPAGCFFCISMTISIRQSDKASNWKQAIYGGKFGNVDFRSRDWAQIDQPMSGLRLRALTLHPGRRECFYW